jgi:hypothetical protein
MTRTPGVTDCHLLKLTVMQHHSIATHWQPATVTRSSLATPAQSLYPSLCLDRDSHHSDHTQTLTAALFRQRTRRGCGCAPPGPRRRVAFPQDPLDQAAAPKSGSAPGLSPILAYPGWDGRCCHMCRSVETAAAPIRGIASTPSSHGPPYAADQMEVSSVGCKTGA